MTSPDSFQQPPFGLSPSVLLANNAKEFTAFAGRFVEKNLGKVLFTAATTTIALANPDAIFSNGDLVFGPDGKPVLNPDGTPVRLRPGLVPPVGREINRYLQIASADVSLQRFGRSSFSIRGVCRPKGLDFVSTRQDELSGRESEGRNRSR